MTTPTPLKNPAHAPCAAALVMIDFISEWRVADRAALLRQVERAVPHAVRLLLGARRAGVPVIYANDNFGQWRSDFSAVWSAAVAAGEAPARIAAAVAPEESDYRVLKPKHSAFFGTPLDLLLEHLGASTLVLCGVAGNQCVTATAIDAHMRDYTAVVVHDASASRTASLHRHAMEQLKDLGLGVVAAGSVRWTTLLKT
jgi:nicotinamidase-related amidase